MKTPKYETIFRKTTATGKKAKDFGVVTDTQPNDWISFFEDSAQYLRQVESIRSSNTVITKPFMAGKLTLDKSQKILFANIVEVLRETAPKMETKEKVQPVPVEEIMAPVVEVPIVPEPVFLGEVPTQAPILDVVFPVLLVETEPEPEHTPERPFWFVEDPKPALVGITVPGSAYPPGYVPKKKRNSK